MTIKAYLYLAAALALLGGLWYVQHLKKQADRVPGLERQLKANSDEYERQRKLNTEISNGYQSDLRRLELERAKPLPRIVCRAASSQARAASGVDAATPEHVGEVPAGDPGRDVTDRLLEYGIAAEANMLQLERLQEWVRSR